MAKACGRAAFCARLSCRGLRRQFLVNLDVVEGAKAILQVRQARLETRQTLLRSAAGEQVPEKIACIAQLLHRDPQLMALLAIKLSDFFRFFVIIVLVRRAKISAANRSIGRCL